ncbi:hypothetical protein OBBRIDRAFT_859354 [Obba rivulosa]|uniref:Uncharacterized protein n=1 Tax=Obba rivulosa TaxID=1052685 RepID=A0A8E2AIX7_9APHY|nr:hypothetical protein OBBRIDRAFT_859354 [Obba rivulosa]
MSLRGINVPSNSIAGSGPMMPSTPPRSGDPLHLYSPLTPLSPVQEYQISRKVRIPDFMVSLGRESSVDGITVLLTRALALIEIKAPDDRQNLVPRFCEAFEQLEQQGGHLFAGKDNVANLHDVRVVGAIVVVGDY